MLYVLPDQNLNRAWTVYVAGGSVKDATEQNPPGIVFLNAAVLSSVMLLAATFMRHSVPLPRR